MIRITISLTKFVIGLVVALAFTSCRFDGTTGNGEVTTSKRDVADFTKVEVERGIELIIRQSDSHSVAVEADSNLHEFITTTVENGVLFVSISKNIVDAQVLKVIVKMPETNGIEATAGSTVKSENSLLSNAITIISDSGSTIEVDIEADKVICEAAGGSQITISGKALSLETSSSSGSSIDATELLANEVTAQANSGSSTDVHPIVSLDAKATSGSSVGYHSIPKKIKVDEGSGGSVSQE